MKARHEHEHEHIRPARATRLATGTMACPRCDAPVMPSAPMAVTDGIGCPFCMHTGRVRDFLSLAPPSRPARVAVSVRLVR